MQEPGPTTRTLSAQLHSFVAIGIVCTAALAAIYSALRGLGAPPIAANAAALLLTMGLNFEANRRLTFEAGDTPVRRQLGRYLAAYAVGLGAASLVLTLLLAWLGHPSGALDTGAAVLSGFAATIVRFVLMRGWVFASPAPGAEPAPEAAVAT
jgi:putative flippase GtrA